MANKVPCKITSEDRAQGRQGIDMHTVFFHSLPFPSPAWKWKLKIACGHEALKSGPGTAQGRLFYYCLLGMSRMVGLSQALTLFRLSALRRPSLSLSTSPPEWSSWLLSHIARLHLSLLITLPGPTPLTWINWLRKPHPLSLKGISEVLMLFLCLSKWISFFHPLAPTAPSLGKDSKALRETQSEAPPFLFLSCVSVLLCTHTQDGCLNKGLPSPLSLVRLSHSSSQATHSQTKPVYGAARSKVNDCLFLAKVCVCTHVYFLSLFTHFRETCKDSGPHTDNSTCPDWLAQTEKRVRPLFNLTAWWPLIRSPFLGILDLVITLFQLWHPAVKCRQVC